jgi:nucleotide-binding universal stress UspA family protein
MVCRDRSVDTEVRRVLIPVSNIKYALLSLKLAEALMKGEKIPLVLFHATKHENTTGVEQRYLEELEKRSAEITPSLYEIIVKKAESVAEAVLEESDPHDLIIMGAPEEGLVRRALFGDLPAMIARQSSAPLILTKRYTGHVKSWFQKFFGSRKTMLD